MYDDFPIKIEIVPLPQITRAVYDALRAFQAAGGGHGQALYNAHGMLFLHLGYSVAREEQKIDAEKDPEEWADKNYPPVLICSRRLLQDLDAVLGRWYQQSDEELQPDLDHSIKRFVEIYAWDRARTAGEDQ